jgi:NADH:ubiquinone oxidoreductase subunit 6 (subunit J)
MAQNAAPARTAAGYDWGSTAAVGMNLFNDYLFPFEAVSMTAAHRGGRRDRDRPAAQG